MLCVVFSGKVTTVTDVAEMVNKDQTTAVELQAMEEVKPLRQSDSAGNVEIKDGQPSKSEQSCGMCLKVN